jgi:hypothetical protein
VQESESERAKRHGRLEHEQEERDRHERLAHEAGVKSGRVATEVERQFAWDEDARNLVGDDISGLPEYVDIIAPKEGEIVSGKQIVRYDFCGDPGIVKFVLLVNRVQVRAKNCGADNFVHTRGNRFVLDFSPYPDGPIELKILMMCANDNTYVSQTVKVIVKGKEDNV